MDQPERAADALPPERVAALPPPPFVDAACYPDHPRLAALSPRVAVLIVAAVVIGLLLWMARDAVRPFVLGLLLVYLLDRPVRWLARRGMRRSIAIVVVYVVAVVIFLEFLNLTLTPLINELVRLLRDLPGLAQQLQDRADRLAEIYDRLAIPDSIRQWIEPMISSITQGGPGGGSTFAPTDLIPVVTGLTSIVGGLFAYVILPVWVFFILKDRVTLTRQFERSLPAPWRFDVFAALRIVRRVFGQWVR